MGDYGDRFVYSWDAGCKFNCLCYPSLKDERKMQEVKKSEIEMGYEKDSEKSLYVIDPKVGAVIVGGTTVALVAAVEQPASAAPVDDILAMVGTLGGITAAVVVIVLAGMGARMGIKMVNRVASKG